MKSNVNDTRIENTGEKMKLYSESDYITQLFNLFTESANGLSNQVLSKGTPLPEFINKRTSGINIMQRPFIVISEVESNAGFENGADYLNELSHKCSVTDDNVFNGYISDKLRYAILNLVNAVVKQIAYEFEWIDENELINSFREISKGILHWSVNTLFDINVIDMLIKAHYDYYGEYDTNREDHLLQMAGPMIEYTSTSLTVIIADMIFDVLYNMVFAVADGKTYRIVCDTISEIVISFRNSISNVLVEIVIEATKHRRTHSFSNEKFLENNKPLNVK